MLRVLTCEGSLPAGDPLVLALVHGVAKLGTARRLPFQTEFAILGFAAQAIQALNEGSAPKLPPVRKL